MALNYRQLDVKGIYNNILCTYIGYKSWPLMCLFFASLLFSDQFIPGCVSGGDGGPIRLESGAGGLIITGEGGHRSSGTGGCCGGCSGSSLLFDLEGPLGRPKIWNVR